MNKTQRICHFTNERVTGAEIRPTVASGIVTGDASVSYWTILSLSLVTIPEVIAKVNSFFFMFLRWQMKAKVKLLTL